LGDSGQACAWKAYLGVNQHLIRFLWRYNLSSSRRERSIVQIIGEIHQELRGDIKPPFAEQSKFENLQVYGWQNFKQNQGFHHGQQLHEEQHGWYSELTLQS
jgi:hypothetical protein